MEAAPGPNRHVRFGAFELDLRTHELHRNGSVLKLRGHPVRVLEMLVESPGELVTREEIRRRLWPDDTFVDFEHILNNTINRLRDELGDRAEKPVFIETLPRQGYRFIAPVKLPPNGSLSPSPAPNVETILVSSPLQGVAEKRIESVRRIWLVTLAAIVVPVLLSFAWSWLRPTPPFRVAGITQLTHDPLPKLLAGTDGTRLIVNRYDTPETKILQVPVSGGQLSPLVLALTVPWVWDVSSDGTMMMTSGEWGQGVWMVDASGNKLSRVMNTLKFASVAIAPDRESVAYSNFDGEIHLVGKDGAEIRKLTSASNLVGHRLALDLAWSPDGKTLRYTRGHKIWEVSAQGSVPRRVFPGFRESVRECCGHWSRDGSSFVFVLHDSLERFTATGAQIWAMDERRSLWWRRAGNAFQLTSPGPIRWNLPLTSNDGSKIYARGVTPRGELERFDQSAKEFRPFLHGISAEYLDFSRDGNWVAYVTFPDGILWKARRDGSNALQLTRPPLYPLWPRWSPDGSQILFTNAPDDLTPACSPWMLMPDEAYLISSDGGPPQRLLPTRKDPIMYPEWSPDGRKIVFATCGKCETENQADWKIAILEVAGGTVTLIPGSEGAYVARWSPEGRRILVMPIDGTLKARLYDLQTGRWSELDTGLAPSFPAWSHDGRYVYFAGSFFDGAIMRVLATGGKPEPVASVRNLPFTGWFGVWVGLDPDDAPLWLRDTGTDELYALTIARN